MQANLLFTLVSCAFFMAVVAVISYFYTRGEVDSKEGYFLAGRGLGGFFIAGTLLLTNLSAEQLIGLNGSAYGFDLSSMAWEVTAAVATIFMALIFLPRYLAGAFTTLPEFLSKRFDDDVRSYTVILFMLGYGLITIPSVLYSGSVAVTRLFDVESLLVGSMGADTVAGIGAWFEGLFGTATRQGATPDGEQFFAIAVTVVVIGVIGSIYAIFGGLRAVAISDTLNGVGLLVIGILVPTLGLIALGEGSFMEGLRTITTTETQKLNAIGGESSPTPFGTIFTGMIFANLFYWCTNQYVIQRTLGAKSLAEGQKGVLLSGYFKVMIPFMMMMPGVIAFHLYGPNLATIDLAYPQLIDDVLPVYLSGFFLAVLLGAVFSSFNSLLNSAATLFALDVYAPSRTKEVPDSELVRVAKVASLVIAVMSFIISPLLYLAPEGLWQLIRKFTGFYNIPIIAIVIVGLFTRRVPAIGAKIVIGFHVITYGLLRFPLADVVTIHFIHQYAILFVIEVGIMLAAGQWRPKSVPWTFEKHNKVSLAPWRFATPVSVTLMSCVVALYLLFSPMGIVEARFSALFWLSIAGLLVINAFAWFRALSVRKGFAEEAHGAPTEGL
ncbi:solute:sodium symporter family transporter [Parvularcula sp. ZS-1/3]|uniref:Solute:sodium symporter family transporter n=1 Tax=Parvularcula mediterranea TaxID=2732508 RepID=A0A7Y3RMW5_9PROT|nr:solute:sodium symporter family transporter [Parvularcula mediterranea]NNU17027.1 solute:sodium symporter family transporter [Parvularcula mediterranea]